MDIYRDQGKELIITLAQHKPAESVQVIVNMAVVDDFGEQGNQKKRPCKTCNDLRQNPSGK